MSEGAIDRRKVLQKYCGSAQDRVRCGEYVDQCLSQEESGEGIRSGFMLVPMNGTGFVTTRTAGYCYLQARRFADRESAAGAVRGDAQRKTTPKAPGARARVQVPPERYRVSCGEKTYALERFSEGPQGEVSYDGRKDDVATACLLGATAFLQSREMKLEKKRPEVRGVDGLRIPPEVVARLGEGVASSSVAVEIGHRQRDDNVFGRLVRWEYFTVRVVPKKGEEVLTVVSIEPRVVSASNEAPAWEEFVKQFSPSPAQE